MTATITPLNTRRRAESMAGDPHLMRVDTSHMAAPVRMVGGNVEQLRTACDGHTGVCQGLPDCSRHGCQGHPINEVRPEERDGPLLLKVLIAYAAVLALVVWGAWHAIKPLAHLLSH